MKGDSMKRFLQISSALLIMAVAVHADLTFNYTYQFSTSTNALAPAGPGPWLTATFVDVAPDTVDLTLLTTGLTGIEFVGEFYFNLDPLLDLTLLSFSAPTKTGFFADPIISKSINAYKADGDGKYDILIDFGTSDGGTSTTRFNVGDAVKYTISYPGLTASSFNFLSAPAGGAGPFLTAAHVMSTQDITTTSGWVTVPEPASMILITTSTIGLGFIRRRLMA